MKKTKIFIELIILTLVLADTTILSKTCDKTEPAIYIDDLKISCYTEPYIKDGCTMINYKDISDALRVQIEWNRETNKIEVSRYGYNSEVRLVFSMQLNDSIVTKSDKSIIILKTAPELIGDDLYIPLRATCELLHANVKWHEEDRSISIETNTERRLFNNLLEIKVPVFANVFDSIDYMELEDGSYNLSYIGYSVQDNYIEAYIRCLLCISEDNIEDDAVNLGYNIDSGNVIKTDEIEIVSEKFETNRHGTAQGRILIKTKDNILWELECEITCNNTYNYNEGVNELLNIARTIKQKNTYKFNKRDVICRMFGCEYIVHLNYGYAFYTTYTDAGSVINIKKLKTSPANQSVLSSESYKKHDDIPTERREGSFLGEKIIWNICDNGTAYANYETHQFYINNADYNDIDEFIEIVGKIELISDRGTVLLSDRGDG